MTYLFIVIKLSGSILWPLRVRYTQFISIGDNMSKSVCTVNRFNSDNGFGFIAQENGG